MRVVTMDIGGTAIKYGLFANGDFESVSEIETQAKLGAENVFARICSIVDKYSDFDYVAISTAGQINSKEGYVIYANENMPEYTGFQLRKRLEEIYKVPVFVENDVNAMALGEAYFGAGVSKKDFLCLTYGTGIGGAIVIDKKIYYGSSFSAGEFGAIVTHGDVKADSNGYFDGGYEKYASATALVEKAQKYNSKYSNGRIIFDNLDDVGLKLIVDQWIFEILLGLITLINLFNPSCIILGGGVMAVPYVINSIRERVYERVMPSFRNFEILSAALQNKAGMYGALTQILEKE